MGVPLMNNEVLAWIVIVVISIMFVGLVAVAFFSRGPML